MSSFSSQWLANVIALRHYSSVIWDFIRGHTCVCSCDKWKDRENMKKREISCGCAGVCCGCGCDCFIKWLSTEYWARGSVLKMGCRDLNALMSNANNSFFPDIMLSCAMRWLLKWSHMHLLAAFYIFITTFRTWHNNTALSACCDTPFPPAPQ